MTVEKDRKKRIILIILAIVMVCCLIVVGTLAWLRYRTPEEVNTFTMGKGVKIELKEEKFDKDENQERVKEFTPGMMLDKDPTVYIPSVEMDEYIAVAVRYYIEEVYDNDKIRLKEVSYEEFKDYATIYSFMKTKSGESVTGSVISEEENYEPPSEGFRNGWVPDQDYRIFYYGTVTGADANPVVTSNSAIEKVELQKVTSGDAITLFDKVEVSNSYDRYYNEEFNFNKYRYRKGTYTIEENVEGTVRASTVTKTEGQLKGFRIHVCAYAVQGNTDSKIGIENLNNLIEQHWFASSLQTG